jgi:outer membrane protein assembly factor BamA
VRRAAILLAGALLVAPLPGHAQQSVIAAIQVHGNTLTPTDDIIRASGLVVGATFVDVFLADAERRLQQAMRFESVDVLKRYASITDETQILVVIQVDEGPVRIDRPVTPAPGSPQVAAPVVARRSRVNVMVVPILDAEDGYGLAYGLQVSFTGHDTTRRRVVVPASWGGNKRVGAEYQQEFRNPFVPDVRTGALVQRRTHPYFDEHADRRRAWARAEWSLLRFMRAGAELAWQRSSLAGEQHEVQSIGADVIIDTRIDPMMPHNAMYVRAGTERLRFSTNSAVRTSIDANAYLGVYRGAVLALRAIREDSSRPAPAYYKSVLGGSRNLRGFRAGFGIGDTLVAGSAELRLPLTSPLRVARFGISLFADIGTTYDKGRRLGEQRLEQGFGAGVWAAAPVFGISVAVAHGVNAGTRGHISAGLTF